MCAGVGLCTVAAYLRGLCTVAEYLRRVAGMHCLGGMERIAEVAERVGPHCFDPVEACSGPGTEQAAPLS